MTELNEQLKKYGHSNIARKSSTEKVIISESDRHGEGELKILNIYPRRPVVDGRKERYSVI